MQTTRPRPSVQLSVLLAIVCATSLLIGGAAGAETTSGPVVEYVVSPGDTLWEIAEGYVAPGEDVRPLIDAIKRASQLESSTIYPGQVLNVPRP